MNYYNLDDESTRMAMEMEMAKGRMCGFLDTKQKCNSSSPLILSNTLLTLSMNQVHFCHVQILSNKQIETRWSIMKSAYLDK